MTMVTINARYQKLRYIVIKKLTAPSQAYVIKMHRTDKFWQV